MPSTYKPYVGLSLHIIFQVIQSSQNAHITCSVLSYKYIKTTFMSNKKAYTFITTTELWRKPFHSQELQKHQQSCTLMCVFEIGNWSISYKEEDETQEIIPHLISTCLISLQKLCQYLPCNSNTQVFNIFLAPPSSQRELKSIQCDKPGLCRYAKRQG